MNYGIKEAKEVLEAGLSIIDSIAAARADGEITFTDVVYLASPIKDIGAALKDIDQVKQELLDLDDSEQDELAEIVLDYVVALTKVEAKEKAREVIDWVLDGVAIASTLPK